jgi:uncharacterized protein YbjT (DUF2867 family)
MYAITGISGKVGGALARALLADGQPVRAVVRAADKGHAWAERGCEVALAEMKDAASLTAAFKGAQGVEIRARSGSLAATLPAIHAFTSSSIHPTEWDVIWIRIGKAPSSCNS